LGELERISQQLGQNFLQTQLDAMFPAGVATPEFFNEGADEACGLDKLAIETRIIRLKPGETEQILQKRMQAL